MKDNAKNHNEYMIYIAFCSLHIFKVQKFKIFNKILMFISFLIPHHNKILFFRTRLKYMLQDIYLWHNRLIGLYRL